MPSPDNYAVDSGLPIYGGCAAPSSWSTPASVRAAMMGDSLTTHRSGYNLSPFQWINGLAGGVLQLVANAGVGGETVSQMNARKDNAYTNATNPGLAGLGTLGHIFFRGGTNDARASNSVSAFSAICTTLFNGLHAYADKLYIDSVPYLGTGESGYAAKNLLIDGYNAFLVNFAASNSAWCVFIDDTVSMRVSGAQLPQYFQADTIHTNGYGVAQWGIDGYAALASKLAGYAYAAAAPDPALAEWFTNPTFAGTAGTVGAAFSGQAVTGLSIGPYGGGIVAACAVEAATDGGTPWQAVSPTQVTAGGGSSIYITSVLSGRTFTGSDPAEIEQMIELDLVGFNATYFSAVRLRVNDNAGQPLTDYLELKMGGGPLTKRVVLRSRMPRTNANSSTSETMVLEFVIAATFTGAMGKIRFRRISIRG